MHTHTISSASIGAREYSRGPTRSSAPQPSIRCEIWLRSVYFTTMHPIRRKSHDPHSSLVIQDAFPEDTESDDDEVCYGDDAFDDL